MLLEFLDGVVLAALLRLLGSPLEFGELAVRPFGAGVESKLAVDVPHLLVLELKLPDVVVGIVVLPLMVSLLKL